MELNDVARELTAPFALSEVKFKPGSLNLAGDRAQCFPYVDARSIANRLDQVVGPCNWMDDYEVIPGSKVAVICYLRILGITKAGIGEALPTGKHNEELYKGAESDALRRAASKFGLARYIYDLPKVWLAWDGKKFLEPYPWPNNGKDKKRQSPAKAVITEGPPPIGITPRTLDNLVKLHKEITSKGTYDNDSLVRYAKGIIGISFNKYAELPEGAGMELERVYLKMKG